MHVYRHKQTFIFSSRVQTIIPIFEYYWIRCIFDITCPSFKVYRTRNQLSRNKLDAYTQRNIFEILLNQPEIRLYLPFSEWFGRMSVWIQINRCMVNTIWFRVDLVRFGKYFSVCIRLVASQFGRIAMRCMAIYVYLY